jgi:hypothetical protein
MNADGHGCAFRSDFTFGRFIHIFLWPEKGGYDRMYPDIRRIGFSKALGSGQKEARTGTVRQPAGEDACPMVFDRAGHQRCHDDLHHA